MFGFFLFAVLFVTLCLFTAEPAPHVAAIALVEDELPSLEELLTEAEALTARPVLAQSAAIAAPVAVAVVKVEAPAKPIADMNSDELRQECPRRSITWRNAHGKGKHLLKPEMVNALA